MSEFQTVRRRGNPGPQPTQHQHHKYHDQHQKLTEMGFDSHSVQKALESAQGDLEAATIILLGESDDAHHNNQKEEFQEKVEHRSTSKNAKSSTSAAATNNGSGNANASKAAPEKERPKESLKDIHQRVMATYKVTKCKDTSNHDKRTCPNWHSVSDRRRNPFEYNYSCFDCPNIATNGECKDGDNCPHSHTMLEKMFHPELYKISMCQRTLRGEKCDRDALCAFAHNDADLRVIPTASTSNLKPGQLGNDAWKLPPTRPIPPSAKLGAILEKIVILIKESGPEGSFGSDLAKKFEIRYNEKLELEDEQRNSYKFRDVVGSHPQVSVAFNRGAPPRYVYDENKQANQAALAAVAEEEKNAEAQSNNNNEASDEDNEDFTSIKERLVQVIKACGSEGILGSDLPKKYYEMFSEKLDVTDEFGSKIKLKDMLATQGGVKIEMLKLQPKFLYDPSTDKPAPASGAAPVSAAAPAAKPSSQPVHKETPSEPKQAPASVVVSGKSYSSVAASLRKEAAEKEKATAAAAAAKEAHKEHPAAAPTHKEVVPEPPKHEEPQQAAHHQAPAAPVQQHHAPAHHHEPAPAPAATHHHVPHHEEKEKPAAASSLLKEVDGSAPSSEDPIFHEKAHSHGHSALHSILESSKPSGSSAFGHDSSLNFQSPFAGVTFGTETALMGGSSASHHHESAAGQGPSGQQLMGAPGLTKIHSHQPTSALDNTPSLSSLIGAAAKESAGGDFHERLNSAQSQVSTLQSQISKLQSELLARNNDYEGQTLQLRNVMQRLAEAENKTNNSDEHYKLQLKQKSDEISNKQREVTKLSEESNKVREERKGDLNQFFVNLTQIEDAITAMKCKEENYSEKIRQEDVQELLQFKKALKTFVSQLKVHLKTKYDQLSVPNKPLEIESSNVAAAAAANNPVAAASRYGPAAAVGGYDPTTAAYYSGINVPRADAFGNPYNPYAPPVVDSGLCALPGCRNQGHYTCAGCQKVSYCGAEHQRLHWVQHSVNCHP